MICFRCEEENLMHVLNTDIKPNIGETVFIQNNEYIVKNVSWQLAPQSQFRIIVDVEKNGKNKRKFGWVITCGYKNKPHGRSCMINKKSEKVSIYNEQDGIMWFENKEDAIIHMEKFLDMAKFFARRLANEASNTDDISTLDRAILKTSLDIAKYTGTRSSIVSDFVFDMLTEDCKLKTPNCDLDNMEYKITQYMF